MDDKVSQVRDFIEKNKIKTQIIEFDVSTKNSQLAAQALNCPIAQIAKSIVFIVGEPVVIILSGDKRVSTEKLAKVVEGPPSLAILRRFCGPPGSLWGGAALCTCLETPCVA